MSVIPASAGSLGKRPWWVRNARSERLRASGGAGRDHIDAQLRHGASKLRGIVLVDLAADLEGVPVGAQPTAFHH